MTMVNEFPCQAANKGLTAAFGAERIYLFAFCHQIFTSLMNI